MARDLCCAAGAATARWLAIPALAAALLVAALLTSPAHAAARGPDLPGFYRVPEPLERAKPGTLIRHRRVHPAGIDARAYRVMYHSRTVRREDVPVTGLVYVPRRKPPKGGFPMISWAHGTNGMATSCAPSLEPGSNEFRSFVKVNALTRAGFVVAASDYKGEGTPGPSPYIVGASAARDSIDIVRAARQIRAAHAARRYAVWGHSQGGQTALFALRLAARWAPELRLAGAVAGAPPSQFDLLYDVLVASPFKHYLLMVALGFNTAYGDARAPLDAVLTKGGIGLLPRLLDGCIADIERRFRDSDLRSVIKQDPADVPAWRPLIRKNDPANFRGSSPADLLLLHGAEDEQIPAVSSALLAEQLCGRGQRLERWEYPGRNHVGVIPAYFPGLLDWLEARLLRRGGPGSEPPSGVTATACRERQVVPLGASRR